MSEKIYQSFTEFLDDTFLPQSATSEDNYLLIAGVARAAWEEAKKTESARIADLEKRIADLREYVEYMNQNYRELVPASDAQDFALIERANRAAGLSKEETK